MAQGILAVTSRMCRRASWTSISKTQLQRNLEYLKIPSSNSKHRQGTQQCTNFPFTKCSQRSRSDMLGLERIRHKHSGHKELDTRPQVPTTTHTKFGFQVGPFSKFPTSTFCLALQGFTWRNDGTTLPLFHRPAGSRKPWSPRPGGRHLRVRTSRHRKLWPGATHGCFQK